MDGKHSGEKGEITRYQQFILVPQCFQKQALKNQSLFRKVLRQNVPMTPKKFKDREKFPPVSARLHRPTWVDTFHKCIKPPFQTAELI